MMPVTPTFATARNSGSQQTSSAAEQATAAAAQQAATAAVAHVGRGRAGAETAVTNTHQTTLLPMMLVTSTNYYFT